MLARASCATATQRSPACEGSRIRSNRSCAVHSRRPSVGFGTGVVVPSVARDAETAAETDSMTDSMVLRTSKDLAAWITEQSGDVELVRCEGELTPDVESSAKALNIDVNQIVKSLVFKCDGTFVLVVMNGTTKVDTKKIAKRLNIANKRVKLATAHETITHCGYRPGTVPPFGHREKLKTFIDDGVPDIQSEIVFGGGGDIDMEVKVTVMELIRLTKGELLDVKKQVVGMVKTPEGDTTSGSKKLENEKEKDCTEKVSVPKTFDERYGDDSNLVSYEVAKVMGIKPGDLDYKGERRTFMSTPSWRDAKAASISSPTIISVKAEVVRVRRVARFLVFATLRPLAEATVEASDAYDEAQRDEAMRDLIWGDDTGSSVSNDNSNGMSDKDKKELLIGTRYIFPPDTELQLIAGTSLVTRLGKETAEHAVKSIKQGSVVEVTGRVQANPRPSTVDLVARSVVKLDGGEALRLLADSSVSSMSPTTERAPSSAYKRLPSKDEEWGVGVAAVVADMAFSGFGGGLKGGLKGATKPEKEKLPENENLKKLAALRVGAREGKTEKFPSLPEGNVHWVDGLDGIRNMRAMILDVSQGSGDGSYSTNAANSDKQIPVVGIDAEWVPKSGSPVALLQLATRTNAFLIDMLTICGGGDRDLSTATELNRFLTDLFTRQDIVKLGFGLEHDFSKLRKSYQGMTCVEDVEYVADCVDTEKDIDTEPSTVKSTKSICNTAGFVDIRTAALLAFPEKRKLGKVGLATTVSSILGCYVDKTEQCSDWSLRPLSETQTRYAASDAHVLTALFDRCVFQFPEVMIEKLNDSTAPLAKAPLESRGGSPSGSGKKKQNNPSTKKNHAPREPPQAPMTELDLIKVIGTTSFSGRKHVVDELTGYPVDQQSFNGRSGGGLELAGEFVLVFVNVFGRKNKRRYFNEFWVNEGDGKETVSMSWFGGSGQAGTAHGVAKTLGETTALDSVESFFGTTGEGSSEENQKTENQKTKKTVALFLRKEKGPYVCCGRLRVVDISGDTENGSTGARVEFSLVDSDTLRESGAMERVLGENIEMRRSS